MKGNDKTEFIFMFVWNEKKNIYIYLHYCQDIEIMLNNKLLIKVLSQENNIKEGHSSSQRDCSLEKSDKGSYIAAIVNVLSSHVMISLKHQVQYLIRPSL